MSCNSLCLESWYSIVPSSLIHLLSSTCLSVSVINLLCDEVESIVSQLSSDSYLLSSNSLQQFRQVSFHHDCHF